jgi:NADH dehydrogenase [ubiquinone] 1 alpha subcomplex assembly factor 7
MNALETIIREIIGKQGAISLAAYMELALQHPEHGYYRVREPIGRTGDFVTAPEVSQMFGEMLGVWCAEVWRAMGKPDPFALVELGPGRGTMMQDILRATANVGGFHDAKKLCLLDSDKALRGQQRKAIGENAPRYIENISQLPSMPAIIVANEFFDALPIRQFEKTFQGWAETMVTVADEALVMTKRTMAEGELNLIPPDKRDADPGMVIEISPKAQNMLRDLVRHIATQKGAMLMIDYGYVASSGASTVQAVSNHAYASIFERPGEVDLTAHVDFTTLARLVEEMGASVLPIIGQGEFLKNLGIKIRADGLKKQATMPQAAEIDVALHRLIDVEHMGQLFKVMEIRAEG